MLNNCGHPSSSPIHTDYFTKYIVTHRVLRKVSTLRNSNIDEIIVKIDLRTFSLTCFQFLHFSHSYMYKKNVHKIYTVTSFVFII